MCRDELIRTVANLDNLLFIFGLCCQPKTKSISTKVFLLCLRVLNVSNIVYLGYSSLSVINRSNYSQHVQLLSYFTATYASQVIFARRHTRFDDILQRLKCVIGDDNKRKLKTFARRLILAWMCLVSIDTVHGLLYSLRRVKVGFTASFAQKLFVALYHVLSKRLFLSGWLIILLCIYSIIVFGIHLSQENFFRQFFISKYAALPELYSLWFEIIKIKNDFEGAFSFYPVVWIFNLFGRTAAYVFMHTRSANAGKLTKMYLTTVFWSYFTAETFLLIGLLSLIQYTNSCSRTNYIELKVKLLKFNNRFIDEKYEVLLEEIHITRELQLTAWGVCRLSKGLLLAFLSNLVSFAVLFDQLLSYTAKM